jgi:tRNA (mo5U34)-methyltransferase
MTISNSVNINEIRRRISAVPYWFHTIEVAPGIFTPGEDDTPSKLKRLGIPENLNGKRVLDIGAYDGFFSFECERRGAKVTAVDLTQSAGFPVAHELLSSKVNFLQSSIYDLDPERFGQFDLILCLGVLYHLRHPLLGLDKIRAVCRGELILESQICDRYFINNAGVPIDLAVTAPKMLDTSFAQFYAGAELNGDPSNWWSPNIAALRGMLHSSGFSTYQEIENGVRATIHCRIQQ